MTCKCGKDHEPFYIHNVSDVVEGEYETTIEDDAYMQHMFHMTSEELHSKSDIAIELARRDIKIAKLLVQLEKHVDLQESAWMHNETLDLLESHGVETYRVIMNRSSS
jgi:hypothetical protein